MPAPQMYKLPHLVQSTLDNTNSDSGVTSQTLQNATSSSSIATVGPSAGAHLSNSQQLQDDLDQLNNVLQGDPQGQSSEAQTLAKRAADKITNQPLDGAATLLASIMNSTGFRPWALPTDFKADQDPQLPKFQAFLDAIAGFDQVFVLKESEIKVLSREHSDFSILIKAVKNLVSDAVGVAEDVGTAIATDGADSGDLSGAGQKLIDSITNIVNVASTKDNYEESSSLCLANIFHVNDSLLESDAVTVSFFYSFLHLVEDTTCGKTTRQESLMVAYAKFGFLAQAWREHYSQVALQYDLTSFTQMYDAMQSPQGSSKPVATPNWSQAVGTYKPRTPQDDIPST